MRRPLLPHRTYSIAIFILIAVLALLNFFNFRYSGRPSEFDSYTISGDLDRSGSPGDSLPYYQYKKIADSVQREKNLLSIDNEWNLGNVIGLANVENRQEENGYLVLPGYGLKHATEFYHKKGRYYFKYPVWDRIETQKGNKTASGHYERKETNVLYKEGTDKEPGKLYVPVDPAVILTLQIVFYLFILLFLAACLRTFLYYPLLVLYSIAKGDAFTGINIRRLYAIGRFLIIMGVGFPLLKALLYFILRPGIPEQVRFSVYNTFAANSEMLLAGLVALLIAKAFHRGFYLQKEQDLTV